MKKIISILLVITALITLVSCSKETPAPTPAIVCGDTVISAEVYYGQLLNYKNDFLVSYLGLTEDNPSIWAQDSPSSRVETMGETLTRMAVEDMAQFAWVIEYARNNGATITDEDRKNITESIETLKSAFATEEEYQEYLKKMKMTDDTLVSYLELTLFYDKGFEKLTAEGGEYEITDESCKKYYEENFVTVKHVFFNDVAKEDEEGNAVALTEEEIAEKKAKAELVIEDLEAGTSFDLLYLLSEDSMSVSYPDGLTLTYGFTGDAAYEDAAFSLKEGEYKMINGTNGGIYIIMRYPISETDYEDYFDYVKTLVGQETSTKIYSDHKGEVTVNQEVIDLYPITDVPILAD